LSGARGLIRLRAACAGLAVLVSVGAPALAEDMPVFKVVMKDGTIEPARLEVPANTPFKIEITNAGQTPAEFESTSLHKEKVLIGGSSSSMVFRRLEPGEYDFFDDFHLEAKALLVAK
jgi:hypothetical protein